MSRRVFLCSKLPHIEHCQIFEMPAVELRIPDFFGVRNGTDRNPLPSLLQTPSGLAIVEIQGTIHGPFQHPITDKPAQSPTTHQLGRLEFPLYSPQAIFDDGKWMKKVYLYVGKHQRLTGEVKKLAKPLGVIRKVDDRRDGSNESEVQVQEIEGEALEIVDVVKFKVLFSGRPEPVGE